MFGVSVSEFGGGAVMQCEGLNLLITSCRFLSELRKVLWNIVALPLSFWRMEHAVDVP